ncbi:ParB N-terminal domain-containing protein [Marivita sp. S6314]|uniref:ParB N-terminal domain-containing protein n=1 Tax=Marivita sp. S6314 TaxID=2926406 RepID=UPI001FF143DD|nr:ParB N-terminal domain-containing protein [Marivita sp. S6314]MCK0149393.1 ParB N-terminal domain-containing protein [Marivita sp. S6314]
MANQSSKTLTTIDHRQVELDHNFRFRSERDSETHLASLRKTLRNTGKLDPIMVWQEVDANAKPTGRLVLIDGHYRFGAYRAEHGKGTVNAESIPAFILKCDAMDAALTALAANSKDVLPLSAQERANAAWLLVRRHRMKISKSRLSRASGVAERTIAYMRAQLRKFDELEAAPSGNWSTDRRFPDKNDWEEPTDEQRQIIVDAIATGIKNAIRENRTSDDSIIADALSQALGQRQLRAVADYIFDLDGDGEIELQMTPDEFERPMTAEDEKRIAEQHW